MTNEERSEKISQLKLTAINFRTQIHEIDNKLERLEERLIGEDISRQIFDKYGSKYTDKRMKLRKIYHPPEIGVRNLIKLCLQ